MILLSICKNNCNDCWIWKCFRCLVIILLRLYRYLRFSCRFFLILEDVEVNGMILELFMECLVSRIKRHRIMGFMIIFFLGKVTNLLSCLTSKGIWTQLLLQSSLDLTKQYQFCCLLQHLSKMLKILQDQVFHHCHNHSDWRDNWLCHHIFCSYLKDKLKWISVLVL